MLVAGDEEEEGKGQSVSLIEGPFLAVSGPWKDAKDGGWIIKREMAISLADRWKGNPKCRTKGRSTSA